MLQQFIKPTLTDLLQEAEEVIRLIGTVSIIDYRNIQKAKDWLKKYEERKIIN